MGDKIFDNWSKQVLNTLPFIIISALILIPIGIVFVCLKDVIKKDEYIVDYTNCERFSFDEVTETCLEALVKKTETECVCYYYFNITEKMDGDITIYYELESLNQLRSDYVNSRDDRQLMGILDAEPSENCEPYRYEVTPEGRKPIVPCGAIADALFNDTYQLRYVTNDTVLPFVNSGIISDSDKAGYHNPENLDQALKDFAKPKSWNSPIWELDTSDPSNNGFQNERFIGWMKTEWKRKPLARVDKRESIFKNGLPDGLYELRVGYNYPTKLYLGRRLLILTTLQTSTRMSLYVIGVIALVVGLVLLTIAIAVVLLHKQKSFLFNKSSMSMNETLRNSERLNNTLSEANPLSLNNEH